MDQYRKICKNLKELRNRIANANGLNFKAEKCQFKGICFGACSKCEQELEDLIEQLFWLEQDGRKVLLRDIMTDKEFMMFSACGPSLVTNTDENSPQSESNTPTATNDLSILKQWFYPKTITTEDIIHLPEYYQRIQTLPNDPEGTVAYGIMNEQCSCIMTAYPLESNEAMDFSDEASLIEGIHNTISEIQALVEVGGGNTKIFKHKYIYSIVKNQKKPSGVQYIVLLDIKFKLKALRIKAFYEEQGITGKREVRVYGMLLNNGVLEKIGGSGKWQQDPYDHNFKRDYLMTLSELQQFDEMFPGHPLTLARQMIKRVTEQI